MIYMKLLACCNFLVVTMSTVQVVHGVDANNNNIFIIITIIIFVVIIVVLIAVIINFNNLYN